MKYVQLSLDDFFTMQSTKQPIIKKQLDLTMTTAKQLLEPLFIRPIPNDSRYTTQLEEEYELIDKNSFAPVFLQVRTVLEIIQSLGPPAPPHIIRGSAGSSLVTYLLGITHVDPILNCIELARFMNDL